MPFSIDLHCKSMDLFRKHCQMKVKRGTIEHFYYSFYMHFYSRTLLLLTGFETAVLKPSKKDTLAFYKRG